MKKPSKKNRFCRCLVDNINHVILYSKNSLLNYPSQFDALQIKDVDKNNLSCHRDTNRIRFYNTKCILDIVRYHHLQLACIPLISLGLVSVMSLLLWNHPTDLLALPLSFPCHIQSDSLSLLSKKTKLELFNAAIECVFAHFVTRKSRQKPAPMPATRRLFLRQRHRRHLLRGGFGLSWRLGLWNLLVACASGSKLGFLHISNPTSRGSR